MPNPADFASQDEFMKACVPMAMGESKSQKQAVAQCMGMWNTKGSMSAASKSVMACAQFCRDCVAACIECVRACRASAYADTKAAQDCIEACHHCIAVCSYCAAVCEEGNLDEIEKACRDCISACEECMQACRVCAKACPDCKEACQVCYDACMRCADECKRTVGLEVSGGMSMKSSEFSGFPASHAIGSQTWAVKAMGDWKLDVNPVPFGSRQTADSDGQWFDEYTEIMEKVFKTPLVIYQHGIKRGGRASQEKPTVIGYSVADSWKKQPDGWHIKVELDSSKNEAHEIMQAAYKREVAVSSDSISHLARLDVGGRLIQYEKNRPGRIAVWPLAGFSLWEMGGGNFRPANRSAVALPAMKAIYRAAGLPFPELKDTPGVSNYASAEAARRAKVAKENAQNILKKLKQQE